MVEAAAPAAPGLASAAPVSRSYRVYALWILLLAYILSFLDRQVVTILAEPIKHDLKLKDWHLGALTGLAFAAFYTFLGIPIARLAERWNRPFIIGGSLALWSGFTILSGQAQNFVQMLLARLGVGFGEAGCNPCAHSLIADTTPREKRASALAFYSLGVPIGSLLGLIMGGLIADAYGWRMAFLVAGAPGLVLAVIAVLTLKEPRRQLSAEALAQAERAPPFPKALAELLTKRTFWLIAVSTGILAFVGYGHGAFMSSFFLRNHGDQLAQVAAGFGMKPLGFLSISLGLITGVSGMAGTFAGGQIADHFAKRDHRGYVSVPAVAALLALPVFYFIFTVDNPIVALFLLAIPNFLNTLWYGPVYATAQSVVQPHTRSTAAAVLLFVLNMIGLGLGPLCVGMISDAFATAGGMGEAEGVRWAMIVSAYTSVISVVLFWMARKTIREDMVS
jgi:predicted MFS family arabinose efflux permease